MGGNDLTDVANQLNPESLPDNVTILFSIAKHIKYLNTALPKSLGRRHDGEDASQRHKQEQQQIQKN